MPAFACGGFDLAPRLRADARLATPLLGFLMDGGGRVWATLPKQMAALRSGG